MPNVSHRRKEYRDLLPQYDLIEDCVNGERAVKARRTIYLPQPNAELQTPENMTRYDAYLTRAVFYNVTKRTLAGLVGEVYLRNPVVEIPNILDAVHWDATGGGITLEQLSKRACQWSLSSGRTGLFVDYPRTDKPASRADIDNGNIRPILRIFDAKKVINWRTLRKGAREYLSLVVIEDEYVVNDDGFMQSMAKEWLVLRMDESNRYVQERWRTESDKVEELVPLGSDGKPLDEIPFIFIGSENNDAEPDNPPLYDLASLNIGHYRNSADYEESCYIVGQPTPFLSGLSEEWVKNILKDTVSLGSRTAIPLPAGGQAGLLQARENSMPFEAMQHKERQMVALGAKLVEARTVQRTAKEAEQEKATELSTLSSVAQNVSSAFTWALEWCARFVGVSDAKIKFELNTEFDLTRLSPEERRQLIEEWQAGGITWDEYRDNLRRGGIAKLDDDEAKKRIQQEIGNAPNLGDNNDAKNDG